MLENRFDIPPADFQYRAVSGMSERMDRPAQPPATRERDDLVRLLNAVARGDRAAFSAVYDRTSAKLYGICLRLLGDEGEAQEVLQEVYLVVWRKAGMFDEKRASPITWLATLARNRSIDRIRSRRMPTEELDPATDFIDESPSSLEVLEQDQDAERLRACLDELEAKARDMIRSAFFLGATYSELALREAVPLPTMKSWIRRGLQRLRGCLER